MYQDYSYEEIYAITEVLYIINKLKIDDKNKIPHDFLMFLMDNYDKSIYDNLNITNDNIKDISNEGKLLLKIIDMYIN
jgi:hypothetical protein